MTKSWIGVVLAMASLALQAETVPGLGTADFPTTTKSAEAQAKFIHGLLLLHVFEYPDAAKEFQAAEKLDPGFAMAYWGEAMTYDHPVWNQTDVKAGQAALAKFAPTPEMRAGRIPDARERAFLGAVELLYTGKCAKRDCDAQYAAAMEKMAAAYPKDDEAQLFYALALLGKSQGVRDVPVYLKAAAISKAVFARNPQHPGAAHYWIHGMDDPQHAAGALVPARALSKIAPDAGHSQHMCSHIFMALGMWEDVVASNVNAMRVVDEHARAASRPLLECGHYAIWLEYGYYQQGRMRDGDHALAECKRTGDEAARKGVNQAAIESLVRMRGISVIDTRDWSAGAAAMKLDEAVLTPANAGYSAFTSGYAAVGRGDAGTAEKSLAAVRAAMGEIRKQPVVDTEALTDLGLLADELKAQMLAQSGDRNGAIALARKAAAQYEGMAFDFGPPVTVKPPDELLGELLLEGKNPGEAKAAFAASLKMAPRRAQSLLGLARAQNALGDKTAARKSYAELLTMWQGADAGYAPKLEAEKFVGK